MNTTITLTEEEKDILFISLVSRVNYLNTKLRDSPNSIYYEELIEKTKNIYMKL